MKEAKQFLFEVSPDHKTEEEFGKLWDKAVSYPKGDEIRRHINPQTWAFLEKRFRRSNYLGKDFYVGDNYVKDIRFLRPWAIAFYVWQIRGYSDIYHSNGVDHYMAYNAMRAGKAVSGLETPAEHVEVLSKMDDIDAELLLLDALVRGDKRRDDYNAMRAAWRHGDVATIAAIEERVRNLNYRGELRLLDFRNLHWIRKIDAAFKSGTPTAIVAGCNHFCGTNSVCELLAKCGYKMEQL
jgi:uncharacterized protein YbaP (TraB family)